MTRSSRPLPAAPAAAAAAALLPLAVAVGLTWPLVLDLRGSHMVTAWGDSHAWILDHLARHLLAGEWEALAGKTAEAGYPVPRYLRAVGGVLLVPFLLLRPLVGPLAAASIAQLSAFPLTGLVTFGALGRLTDAGAWTRAFAATAFALGPTVISTLGMGEISNTQAWVLPAFLWAAAAACPLDPDRPARPVRALLAAAVGLLGGLSSPYYALALPLISGGWFLAAVVRRREALARRVLHAGLPVAFLALGLLPVGAWFDGEVLRGPESLVEPAPRALRGDPAGQPLPDPAPVATAEHLLLGPPSRPRSPWQSDHVAYLGLVLVAGALLQARRRGRGRALGLALAAGGTVLALGPWLAVGDAFASLGGRAVPTPVRLIELLGYPTKEGGLYFRYAVVAELGLVVLLCAGLAGRRRGAALAGLVAALHVADGVRSTAAPGAGRWPVRVEAVADRHVLEAMAPPGAPDPMAADGAVLELPVQGGTDAWMAQGALLRALFHRRPTTGVLRDVRAHEDVVGRIVDAARRRPRDAADKLRAAGFRYVVLPRALAEHSTPIPEGLDRLLGPRWHDGELLVWDLGPAELSLVETTTRRPPPPPPSGSRP